MIRTIRGVTLREADLPAIEFHGRLCRSDGRPANPGVYDLLFRLHASVDDDGSLWEDEVRGVSVAAGGYYHAVLGSGRILVPELFDGSARFVSVRIMRDGVGSDEMADRVPVLGLAVRLSDALGRLEARVAALEAGSAPVPARRSKVVRRRLRFLRRKLAAGEDMTTTLATRLSTAEARLTRLDAETGRVARLEDEVEDLVGPDGDVVDLDERLAAVEARLARIEGAGR